MYKRNPVLFLYFFVFISFCSAYEIKVGLIEGINSAPFAFMLEDSINKNFENEKNYISFVNFSSPYNLVEAMNNGEIDAANFNVYIAEELYNLSFGQISIAAVISHLNFHIVSNINQKLRMSDLLGKKIYVNGKGLGYNLFACLLSENQIPIEYGISGVELIYTEKNDRICSMLLNDKIRYAILSEPEISIVKANSAYIKNVLDLQEEYISIFGKDKKLAENVLIVRTNFFTQEEEAFFYLINSLKKSVLKAALYPIECSTILKKYYSNNKNIFTANAVKESSFVFEAGTNAKNSVLNTLSLKYHSFPPEKYTMLVLDYQFGE